MDATTKSLVNVGMSVLVPVLVLSHCSAEGEGFWQLGTTPALVIALSLPIIFGVYLFALEKKCDALNLTGLAGTVCTALVTIYATTGGEAIRPDTPWWYAAKEALVALIMAGAILATARSKGALLRVFLYTDALFDVKRIEQKVGELKLEPAYNQILWRASFYTAASLVLSSVANFALALVYLLPVLGMPEEVQRVEYNYAIATLTWMGYLIIGIPLMGTLVGVMVFLMRRLAALTGLTRDELLLR